MMYIFSIDTSGSYDSSTICLLNIMSGEAFPPATGALLSNCNGIRYQSNQSKTLSVWPLKHDLAVGMRKQTANTWLPTPGWIFMYVEKNDYEKSCLNFLHKKHVSFHQLSLYRYQQITHYSCMKSFVTLFSKLHTISYFGIHSVLSKTPLTVTELDSKDGEYKTPLSWASPEWIQRAQSDVKESQEQTAVTSCRDWESPRPFFFFKPTDFYIPLLAWKFQRD